MKKVISLLLALFIAAAFSSCLKLNLLPKKPVSSSQAQDVSEPSSEPQSKPEPSSEPSSIIEPSSSEEPSSEPMPETDEPPSKYESSSKSTSSKASGDPIPWLVYGKEQYNINIFLSNFSEQDMGNFDVSKKDFNQMIGFAYLKSRINTPSDIYGNENGECMLTLKQVNKKLKRYFDTTLSKPKSSYSYWWDIQYDGEYFYFPSDVDFVYNQMSVAEQVLELPNGNFEIHFAIYTVDKYNNPGDYVTDKSLYYMDPTDAKTDSRLTFVGTGVATVKNKGGDDFSSLRLIKYKLNY